jgi:hypothetical protein
VDKTNAVSSAACFFRRIFARSFTVYASIRQGVKIMRTGRQTAAIQIKRDFKIEWIEEINCLETRKKLDALFSGKSPLKNADRQAKRSLFNHLESCERCCHAFDVRVRFRIYQPNSIC